MNKLLEKEYIHLGTNNIKRELWINVYEDQFHKNNAKVQGGLWTSPINYGLGDWIEYLKYDQPYTYDYVIGNKKCCLVKFKENSKLLKIEDKSDYNNLVDSGFVIPIDEDIHTYLYHNRYDIKSVLDYDRLLKNYDLLYINPSVSTDLLIYRIKTLLAINPNTIEYFKPIDVDYTESEILKVHDKEYIKEPNKDFYDFLNYIDSLFISKTFTSIEELESFRDNIIDYLKQKYETLGFNIGNIDTKLLIENNVKNSINVHRKLLKK